MADLIQGWDGAPRGNPDASGALLEVETYGGTPITVYGGIDASNALTLINLGTMATATTITAVGLYEVPCGSNLSMTGSSGSVVNLKMKR